MIVRSCGSSSPRLLRMRIDYCEVCDTRLTEEDFESGKAMQDAKGHVYCSACAPSSAKPAPPTGSFKKHSMHTPEPPTRAQRRTPSRTPSLTPHTSHKHSPHDATAHHHPAPHADAAMPQ